MTTIFASSALVCFPKPKNKGRIRLGISASPSTSSSSSASASSLSLRKSNVSELGFVTSQLGGIKISSDHPPFKTPSFASPPPAIQPIVARRICRFTGKKANRANKVSFSNKKSKKLQFVNLQYKRVWWEAGKRFLDLRLSTNAMRTIDKIGLDALAKKAGIDLRKE